MTTDLTKLRPSQTPTLHVRRLSPTAALPAYATANAAAFDLRAHLPLGSAIIQPGMTLMVPTGLTVEFDPGWALMLYSRSGHAAKNLVRLGNCVGVIDSDYRGEVMVLLHNDGLLEYTVVHQERIAQGVLVQVPMARIEEVQTLTDTARGTGGFGSTGSV